MTVVEFHGGVFHIDTGEVSERKFFIGFDGLAALYGEQQIDLSYKGSFAISRSHGQPDFVEFQLVPDSLVYISFDCSFAITHLIDDRFSFSVDGGDPNTIWLPIHSVRIDRFVHLLSETGQSFSYPRTSGESATVAEILPAKGVNVLRVPFKWDLRMKYFPITSDELADPPDPPRLAAIITDDRIEAWGWQQKGMKVIHKEDGAEWEPVELTKAEQSIVKRQNRAQRQQQFDEKCSCLETD